MKRQGGGFERAGEMPAAQAQSAMGPIAAQRGTVVNYDRPFLEAELPIDGSRIEGILPLVLERDLQKERRMLECGAGPRAGAALALPPWDYRVV